MAELNTDFPAWMAQSTRDNANIGSMLGQNILQGLRFQEEKARFAELEPLRNAQIATAQAQARILQNDANLSALAAEDEARARGSMADAMALSQDIAGSPNGYTNPESEARFYSFLGERPWLGNTQWAKQQEERFNAATQYRRRAEELTRVQQNAIALEKERTAGDLAVAKERNAFGTTTKQRDIRARVEAEIASGKITPDQAASRTDELFSQGGQAQEWKELGTLLNEMGPEAALAEIADTTQGPGAYKVKQAATSVGSMVSALKRAGIEPPKDEIEYAFSGAMSGYGAPNADAKTVKDLATENTSATLLDKAVSDMDAFNQKYGEGKFEEFVGPFDNRVLKFKRGAIDPKELTSATNEANRIFRNVAQIIQGYRNGQFGTALTSNETSAFRDIVSDPTFADYKNAITGFKDTLRDTMRAQVKPLLMAPNVRLEYKKKFYVPDAAETPEASTPTPGSGINILNIEVIP